MHINPIFSCWVTYIGSYAFSMHKYSFLCIQFYITLGHNFQYNKLGYRAVIESIFGSVKFFSLLHCCVVKACMHENKFTYCNKYYHSLHGNFMYVLCTKAL